MNKLHRAPVVFTARAIVYIVTLMAAFVFAQLVKLPVAHMTFLFVAALPLVTLIQLAAALIFVRVSAKNTSVTTKKASPAEMLFTVRNRGIIPFSMVHVYISSNRSGKVTETERNVLALMPFSGFRLTKSMDFPFLGEYPVTISGVYVYDIFGMIGVRVPCRGKVTVTVLPRCPKFPPSASLQKGVGTPARLDTRMRGGTEAADVRTYENGDSTKQIHWKLSGKSEELFVREMASESGADTLVLLDLEPITDRKAIRPEAEDFADRALADNVIEAAIGAAHRRLTSGYTVCIGCIFEGKWEFRRLHTASELDGMLPELAKLAPDETESQLTALYDLAPDKSALPVFVTPSPFSDKNMECATSAARDHGSAEIVSCIDSALTSRSREEGERMRRHEADLRDGKVTVIHALRYFPRKKLK